MNPALELLQPYPFEKLAQLKSGLQPAPELEHISLSIGEPKHAPPAFVLDALKDNLDKISNYPTTKGSSELRTAIANWLEQRFHLPEQSVDPEHHVLPVNGTREALFAFAQAVVTPKPDALVLMPNPFYQIYEGAALLAGAEPYFLNCCKESGYQPDFEAIPEHVWQRCQLLYLCSPGNPTGAVIPKEQLIKLIQLADEFDFIIASDECYSELYFDESSPPVGLLEACADINRLDFNRCVVFHSLSKRSNLPGLRSGFVAGDADILSKFLLYRTYHGCAMPLSSQLASALAWSDEQHVRANRDAYRTKFDVFMSTLEGLMDLQRPDAGFYLWAKLDESDEQFAARLFEQQHITVLPGRYIARHSNGLNPGEQHVRMALVATVEECEAAALRIRKALTTG